ncbi:MAG TPA: protein-L-isoaspartate O-methyltransferase [Candidatus Saccharimonadales bacterium]|nr:protein-L-isoaspartate O-methyltransferase [Candidatus Saccharimonadales bacterium]
MDRIDQAFEVVDRANFVPKELRDAVDIDAPLPIGYGQTNSQPYTVRLMLEWLDPQPGEKILDVGSGSGWTTALLAHLVGAKGWVYAVERIPELVEFGQDNAERTGVKNASFFQAGDEFGLPQEAPYDRILVSASADQLPQELVDQLKVGGKMVIPVQHDILEITKKAEDSLDIKKHGGFAFVPLL